MPTCVFVLQYYYPDISGLSQMMTDLTVQLSEEHRWDCSVIAGSSARGPVTWHRLPRTIGSVGIRRVQTISVGKATLLHRVLESSTYYLGVLLRTALLRDVDVVICCTTPPLVAFVVALGLWFRRIPLVYYVQDLYPELLYDMGYIHNPWLMRKLTVANRLVFRRSQKVVTIGQCMADKMKSNYGLKDRSIAVVPNWSHGIAPADVDPGPFVILYTGNIGLAHDFEHLPRLVQRLARCPSIQYRFVGGGQRLACVKSVFAGCGEERVEFLPHVRREDLSSTIGRGHLCLVAQKEQTVGDILPSKYYGYLAAGRPVIYMGTRKSDIGREITTHKLGYVVEHPGDVDFLAQEIRRLNADRDDLQRLCLRVADYSVSTYGLERSAREFAKAIEAIPNRDRS